MERLIKGIRQTEVQEVLLMARREKAINSLLMHNMRPKLIGVAAAAMAMLLIVLLASSSVSSSSEEIRFTGTVTGTSPPEQVGASWWNVSVDSISSGPQTSCDTLRVSMVIAPPVGQIDTDIDVGDQVEVYGNYTADCTVSLNNESFYIVVIPSTIRFTGTVTGTSPPEQVGASWWNVSVDSISSGPQTSCDTLRVSMVIAPPVGQIDTDIDVGDQVEVYGNYTADCTVSLNNESFYIVVIPSTIRFTGTVTGTSPPLPGSVWWDVSVDAISSGPQISCDTLRVSMVIVPPVGHYDSDIGIGDRVEVYGDYMADCTVSLNGLNYSIKRPKYPSIPGIHNGTIMPLSNITVSRLYTLPCPGTGGHTEYVRFWNTTGWNVTATWIGYTGEWHTIFFNNPFILYANETYNYTIQTGSYPQLHYTAELLTATERITCTSFVDVNGNRQENWIPVIRLS